MILTAFTDHYGGPPNIGEIKMVYQPEMSLLVQSLLLNAIDLVVEVPPGKIAEIANTGKFMIIPYNSLAFAFFGYNNNNPILRIKEVRQAFTWAWIAIRCWKTSISAKAKSFPARSLRPPGATIRTWLPGRMIAAKAKALLDKVGIKDTDGDGIREYKGMPLKFKLKIPIYSGNEGGLLGLPALPELSEGPGRPGRAAASRVREVEGRGESQA